METEMGVVIYMHLKYPRDNIDSKYMWVHGSNSLGSSFLAEIPFLTFLALHRKGRSVARWNPAHVTPRVKLYMQPSFGSTAPWVFWPNTIFRYLSLPW